MSTIEKYKCDYCNLIIADKPATRISITSDNMLRTRLNGHLVDNIDYRLDFCNVKCLSSYFYGLDTRLQHKKSEPNPKCYGC